MKCGLRYAADGGIETRKYINIPNQIKSYYGHVDLGIYAKVTKGGLISILNKLHISD